MKISVAPGCTGTSCPIAWVARVGVFRPAETRLRIEVVRSPIFPLILKIRCFFLSGDVSHKLGRQAVYQICNEKTSVDGSVEC